MQRFIKSSTASEAFQLLRPTKLENGKWLRPIVSGRQAKSLRQQAIANGTFGSWEEGKGGWDPSWDSQKKRIVMREPKTSIHERKRAARIAKIEAHLADMPYKIAEHKKAVEAAKPLKGLEKWLAEKDPGY